LFWSTIQPDKVQAALTPVITGQAMGTTLGIPSQNTLKQVASGTLWVEKTLDRNLIWQVHTPQVFRKDVLRHAHQVVPESTPVNDDAELVERAYPEHQTMLMVQDDPFNIKITTPADIQLAEALLQHIQSKQPSVSI
jgi:2-C-methyl-D-erythritol 4-phosphate cytidylyltransferase